MSASSGVRVDADGWGWRHAGRSRPAVHDLDLRIEAGERVLLLGPSGSGKSTLLRGMAGVLGDDRDGVAEGVLLIDGAVPAARRGRAGLVLQDPEAQVILSRIGDDVGFGCENLGVAPEAIPGRVRDALADVGLTFPAGHPTDRLSGGQKQRLALAGVLAMAPGLILLDEPTANLDPAGAVAVRDAVRWAVARRGATLVVVEHRVDLWRDCVDRVVVLNRDGTILASGEPDAVLIGCAEELTTAGVWTGSPPTAPRHDRNPAGPLLLEAAGLTVGRTLPGARQEIAAAGVTAHLEGGRTTAITGANGAWKSTLAATLAGLRAPLSGAVIASPSLRGRLGPDPMRWRSRQLLPRIGMVFQNPEHQILTARVRDELAVAPRALGRSHRQVAERVDELLARLGLTAVADENPFTLSGGEKRRLTVGAVIAAEPRVLVLDEPTFGQDARTWREVVTLIRDQRDAGAAVAVVSHDPAFVAALADDRIALGSAA